MDSVDDCDVINAKLGSSNPKKLQKISTTVSFSSLMSLQKSLALSIKKTIHEIDSYNTNKVRNDFNNIQKCLHSLKGDLMCCIDGKDKHQILELIQPLHNQQNLDLFLEEWQSLKNCILSIILTIENESI